jgi:peptidoglycan/LPS O-acetylase OafA/YrhL
MVLHKILKILTLIIGVVALVMGIWLFASDNQSLVQPLMMLAYAVVAIVLVLVAAFVVKDLFSGNVKNTLISVGAFVLIVAIAYFISDGTATEMKNGEMLTANESQWIGAGLRTFYILAAIAVGAMIFSGIKKLIKI